MNFSFHCFIFIMLILIFNYLFNLVNGVPFIFVISMKISLVIIVREKLAQIVINLLIGFFELLEPLIEPQLLVLLLMLPVDLFELAIEFLEY